MKPILALALTIGFICWNANWVQANHHDHHAHQHGHQDKSKNVSKIFDFATRLMEDLHHEASMDENIITSPLSIQVALYATLMGAAGKTREELSSYLYITSAEPESVISKISNGLKEITAKKDPSFTELNLANGLFVQKDFPIRKEYVNELQKLQTKIENVDFNEKAATDQINKFVSDSTKGRISPLYASPLEPPTQVVLVSALYFHGVWENKFPETNTNLEKFFTGTKDVQVHMMKNSEFVPYYHNHDLLFEAIQIPYKDDFHMGIVLPHKTQTLMNLTHHMTGEDLHNAFYKATSTGVEYKIPRMKFSLAKSLKSVLEKEGLKTIFEKPDFSKMTPASSAFKVTDVYHAANIEVDEKGTVASAVTAIQFSTYSLKPTPNNPIKFYADRPFLLTIFHRPSSVILFQAFVHQPNGATA